MKYRQSGELVEREIELLDFGHLGYFLHRDGLQLAHAQVQIIIIQFLLQVEFLRFLGHF